MHKNTENGKRKINQHCNKEVARESGRMSVGDASERIELHSKDPDFGASATPRESS